MSLWELMLEELDKLDHIHGVKALSHITMDGYTKNNG